MAIMFNFTIDCSKIDKSKLEKGKYLKATGSVNDEVSKFGTNVSVWEDQSKEEKDANTGRSYLGNGNSFWSDGICTVVTKDNPKGKVVSSAAAPVVLSEPQAFTEEDANLPF